MISQPKYISTPFNLEPVVEYLLTFGTIHNGNALDSIIKNSISFFTIAKNFRIYHYVINWLISTHKDAFPDDLLKSMTHDLRINEVRNTLIIEQITSLSQQFRLAGVPVIFIKGSSGFIRGVYSTIRHFISDIDVLVPRSNIDDAQQVLRSHGYFPYNDPQISEHHHHIMPYYHPDHVAAVEIHKELYSMKEGDISWLDYTMNNLDKHKLGSEICHVPSVDDHAWIVLRTNGSGIYFVSRFREAIELLSLLNAGCSISYEKLRKRAKFDAIPRLTDELAYTLKRYFNTDIGQSNTIQNMDKWQHWSDYTRKKLWSNSKHVASRQRFGLIWYLSGNDIADKIDIFNRITLFDLKEDMLKYGKWKIPKYLLKQWRKIKNAILILICLFEYRMHKVDIKEK